MKNLLLITLVLFVVQVVAQDSSKKKNEIGINVFSILTTQTSNYYFASDPDRKDIEINYASGIMYKHYFTKYVFRFAVDYYHKPGNFSRAAGSLDFIFDKMEFRTGFQRFLNEKRFRPYLATDVLFSVERYNGWVTWTDPLESKKFEDYRYFIGIAPAFGAQFQITEKISATAELNVMIALKTVDERDETKNEGMVMRLNPIRLISVNYHF